MPPPLLSTFSASSPLKFACFFMEQSRTTTSSQAIGIENFLRGKNFFVTGATGFLAKVFIEKILRAVPDVGKMFLLIRADNEESATKRIQNEIINTGLFRCLRQSYGESYEAFMLNKLVPVIGNVCETNLGLEEDLAHVIANQINIIVNSAATTHFHERYDVAISANTRGPSNVMNFAKKCKKLRVFVQVSTAYVNGQRRGKIPEKPFRMGDTIAAENAFMSKIAPKLDVTSEIDLALKSKEIYQNNEVVQNKMKELGLERAKKYGWQDTYTFTKAMGEMMIDYTRENIPVVIIRPSIIESSFKEPFPGWIEGNRMLDPIILHYGKGQLTGFLADPNAISDVVPVDMVVNAMLAAISRHGVMQKPDLSVYQIGSSVANPINNGYLASLFYEHFDSSPCLDSKGKPIRVRSMKLFTSMEDFSAQVWEDAIKLTAAIGSSDGKEPRELVSVGRKFVEQGKYLAKIYEPYSSYGERFDNSNTQRLMESMSEEEKKKFGFDVGSIDWRYYITNVHIPGLRRHVTKERVIMPTRFSKL